jgi:arsenate reductase
MAEAFGRVIGNGVFESYSAGTELRDKINQDSVRIMKELGIDMEIKQKSKLLTDIPKVDIAITMGCNVVCPVMDCEHMEDWGLEDPTGKSDEEFRIIRDIIEKKVVDLTERIKNNKI